MNKVGKLTNRNSAEIKEWSLFLQMQLQRGFNLNYNNILRWVLAWLISHFLSQSHVSPEYHSVSYSNKVHIAEFKMDNTYFWLG